MTNSTKSLLAQLDVIEKRAREKHYLDSLIRVDIPALCDAVRELANPWVSVKERLPEQYRGRWIYDYNEKRGRQCFEITTGGYCVAETEDSEVAGLGSAQW